MIDLLAIPAFAIARRVQGGWPIGTPRFVKVVLYAVLCAAMFWGTVGPYTDALFALVAFVGTCALMLPSHDYVPASAAMRHYGSVFGFGYWIGERVGSRFNIKLSPTERWFIDGGTCIGELWLGGSWAAALLLAKIIGIILLSTLSI